MYWVGLNTKKVCIIKMKENTAWRILTSCHVLMGWEGFGKCAWLFDIMLNTFTPNPHSVALSVLPALMAWVMQNDPSLHFKMDSVDDWTRQNKTKRRRNVTLSFPHCFLGDNRQWFVTVWGARCLHFFPVYKARADKIFLSHSGVLGKLETSELWGVIWDLCTNLSTSQVCVTV